VETVQEKAKCVASKNKQLIRRLEEHSQEIESLELYIEKLENCINFNFLCFLFTLRILYFDSLFFASSSLVVVSFKEAEIVLN
jgi:hypothetical protein